MSKQSKKRGASRPKATVQIVNAHTQSGAGEVHIAGKSGEEAWAMLAPGWREMLEHRDIAHGSDNPHELFAKGESVPGIALREALNACLGYLDAARLMGSELEVTESLAWHAHEFALEYIAELRRHFSKLPELPRTTRAEGIRSSIVVLIDWCTRATRVRVRSHVPLLGIASATLDAEVAPQVERGWSVFVAILERMHGVWRRPISENAPLQGTLSTQPKPGTGAANSPAPSSSMEPERPGHASTAASTPDEFASDCNPDGCTHGPDFLWVSVNGNHFDFRKGHQAETIRCLWENAHRAGFRADSSLSEKTIAAAIDASIDNFAMRHTFRRHPAYKWFIVSPKRGAWALNFSLPTAHTESRNNPA